MLSTATESAEFDVPEPMCAGKGREEVDKHAVQSPALNHIHSVTANH